MLTYPKYERKCGWIVPGEDPVDSQKLKDQQSCDAVIVGAGYTGLAIARRLSELCPSIDIRVLEADKIGFGSPGRNSGFVLEHAFPGMSQNAAGVLYKQYCKTHEEISRLSSLSEIAEATSHVFKGAATPRGLKSLKGLAEHLEQSGQPYEMLSEKQVGDISGSSYYLGGIMLPGSRLVNPYVLIRELARNLPSNIRLHSDSPAVSIEQHGSRWQVNTREGGLTTPRVYLANNAFAKHLGYGKSRSVTIYTYAGVTAPLDKAELAWVTAKGQWGVLPANRLGSTLRTTDDGRLLIRSMYGYEQEGGDEVGEILQQSLARRFPDLTGARTLDHWWGGTTSLTTNGAPLWGELKRGLYASIGCNGVGILKGWMLGRELAQLSCGRPTLDVPGLFGKPGWMPPEPARRMGFLAVSGIEKLLAGREI